MSINPDKLNELLGKAVVDFGATFHAALVRVGDKLGLYKALAAGGPQTPGELAKRTGRPNATCANGCAIRQPAGISLMTASRASSLSARNKPSPWRTKTARRFCPECSRSRSRRSKLKSRSRRRFKTGKGLGWHEHHPELFVGTERFFRPGYAANLISSWIPALEGVKEKLERGRRLRTSVAAWAPRPS